MNRAPKPEPSLSARIRPPWASIMPLQMASPRPDPSTEDAVSRSKGRENLRKSSGSSSAGMPRPLSETETATWIPSSAALTTIGDPSGENPAALDSRLPSTWMMRRRSAKTIGRSSASSRCRGLTASPL